MNRKIMLFILGFLLIGVNVFAADGDFIIEGNVGIGTATPSARLQVIDSTAPGTGSSFTFTNPRRGLNVNGTATDNTHPFMNTLNITATRSAGTALINGMSSTIALVHDSTQSGVYGGSASSYTFQIGSATGSGTVDITDVRGFSYALNRRYNIAAGLTYNVADSYGARFDIYDGGSDYGGVVNVSNHYGIYVADYSDSGGRKVDIANLSGIWIESLQGGDENNYGIVLNGDGAGADLVLGSNKEHKIYGNAGNLILDTTGNVGIGTTNPTYRLSLGSGGGKKLAVYEYGNDFYGFGISSGTLEIYSGMITGTEDPEIVVKANGYVGIGTTNPSGLLTLSNEVKGSTQNNYIKFTDVVDSNNEYMFGMANGRLFLAPNDDGAWQWSREFGYDPSSNAWYSESSFGIGTTNPGSYKLYVNGSIWYNGGGHQGSDERYKKNIVSIDNALEKVKNLNGVSYEWKTEEFKEENFDRGRHYGVVAQQVEEILPETVKENSDGYKGVAYTELIPILIEAMKEQQQIMDNQQKKMDELEAEIKKLKRDKYLAHAIQ